MQSRCLKSVRKDLKSTRGGSAVGDGSYDDANEDDGGVDADDSDKAKSEEDVCAWCRESEDQTLFLCDGDDCGRCVPSCACVM